MTELAKSIAHQRDLNSFGQQKWPDGMVEWYPAEAPDFPAGKRTQGSLTSCGYCGSMHPAELAAAIKQGSLLEWADRKYGWPHKVYVSNVPNPHAGMLETYMATTHATPTCPKTGTACEHGKQSFSNPICQCMQAGTVKQGTIDVDRIMLAHTDSHGRIWRDIGKPAPATKHAKFYTVHLQDATPEDREVIERAMGLRFLFKHGSVAWQPYKLGPLTDMPPNMVDG